MKRRFFLINSALSIVGLVASSSAAFGVTGKLVSSNNYVLKSNSIYFVEAGKSLSLPKSPAPGDYLHFSVDTSSVLNPSTIKYDGQRIMGLEADLELDVISNFKIVYSHLKGWVLS